MIYRVIYDYSFRDNVWYVWYSEVPGLHVEHTIENDMADLIVEVGKELLEDDTAVIRAEKRIHWSFA